MKRHDPDTILLLREQIARIERHHGASGAGRRLATGLDDLDDHLKGGLLRGALHEFCGVRQDRALCARPAHFAASILARHPGQIVWLFGTPLDLHADGLHAAGLSPGRVICVEAASNGEVPALCEDILREKGLLALVAELDTPLTLTTSRRLQLTAETGRVTGFLLHRPAHRQRDRPLPPSACHTRWRISSEPSILPFSPTALIPPPGPPRRRVELLRQRAGRPASWLFEVPEHDTPYSVSLASPVANRSVASPSSRHLHVVGAGAALP